MGSDYIGRTFSNTPDEVKDLWESPIEVYQYLDVEFNFRLDAAASACNALCADFITEEQDALNVDWITTGPIWCNPPYSDIMPWVRKAREQCYLQQQPVVLLLPSDTSTRWFAYAAATADEILLVTSGRLSFIRADLRTKGNTGNSKGSIIFIWRPVAPRCKFSTVSKDEIMSGRHRSNKPTEMSYLTTLINYSTNSFLVLKQTEADVEELGEVVSGFDKVDTYPVPTRFQHDAYITAISDNLPHFKYLGKVEQYKNPAVVRVVYKPTGNYFILPVSSIANARKEIFHSLEYGIGVSDNLKGFYSSDKDPAAYGLEFLLESESLKKCKEVAANLSQRHKTLPLYIN